MKKTSKYPLFNYEYDKIKEHLLKLKKEEQKKYYDFVSDNVQFEPKETVDLYNTIYPNEFNLYYFNFALIKEQMNLYLQIEDLKAYSRYVIKETTIKEAEKRDPFSSNEYTALLKQIVAELEYLIETKFKSEATKEKVESSEKKNLFIEQPVKAKKPVGYPFFNFQYDKIKDYLDSLNRDFEIERYKLFITSNYLKLFFHKTDDDLELFIKENKLEKLYPKGKLESGTVYNKFRIELGKIHELCRHRTLPKKKEPFNKDNYLSRKNYYRYAEDLENGYIPENFFSDLDDISKAEDKIGYIRVIIKSIEEAIEQYDFEKSLFEGRVKNDKRDDVVESYNLVYSLNLYKGKANYLKHVLPFVNDELEFWEKQTNEQKGKNDSSDKDKKLNGDFLDIINDSSEKVTQYSINKITWLKNKQDLVKIFDLLAGLGYIAFDKNKDTILRQHFTWVDGEISASSLKSNRNNAKNKKETYKPSDQYKKLLESMKEKLENEIKEINGS